MKSSRKAIVTAMISMLLVTAFSCDNEFTKSASPVSLIVTNSPKFIQLDLEPGAAGCTGPIVEVQLAAILKSANANVDQRFNDVRVTRYRVSYIRTDGGTLVPAPFVRTLDVLLTAGGAPGDLPPFTVILPEALNQAPFAALSTANGGRDPETGRTRVRLDMVLEFFGETLAGSNVSGRTTVPLEFCFHCGGCV